MDPQPKFVKYTELDDDTLLEQYRQWRIAAYNWSRMAGGSSRSTARKVAAGFARCDRQAEIIRSIARKRGINL